MSDYEAVRPAASPAVTRLPDTEVARKLVGAPWRQVEVPGGRLIHRSKAISGAWSASSLLVRGDTDLCVYAESYEAGDEERFCLRFARSTDEWCRSHLQSARPAFSPIMQWPPSVEFPADFMVTGPTAAELGLGSTLHMSEGARPRSLVPVVWYFLRAGSAGLLLFADSEIPLNVGICGVRAASLVKTTLPIASSVNL